ncbi:hypothetical protein [Streptomyces lydicus]|uniref:hypothetical protein n=1 Tax=Streptomyces lydicus TaxID=47763 RepID=UPI00101341A5|nr:hypothetical protein [Streptomyces lydicus]MCZ1012235.1 hypothetical protein [Streptomyces lydicus]
MQLRRPCASVEANTDHVDALRRETGRRRLLATAPGASVADDSGIAALCEHEPQLVVKRPQVWGASRDGTTPAQPVRALVYVHAEPNDVRAALARLVSQADDLDFALVGALADDRGGNIDHPDALPDRRGGCQLTMLIDAHAADVLIVRSETELADDASNRCRLRDWLRINETQLIVLEPRAAEVDAWRQRRASAPPAPEGLQVQK